MPPALNTLYARQQSTDNNNSCPSTISGGAIAGIVIGTIAGTLLILWLIKVCMLPGAPAGRDPDSVYSSGGGIETRHRHRRRPSRYEYVEKPRGSVRKPARVYLN